MNMQLDITAFINNAGMIDYSASCAEIGRNAGTETWNNAKADSAEYVLLHDEVERQAFRDHVKGFGAWSYEEIASWDDTELNALAMQMVAGDVREAELDCDPDERDWQAYYDNDSIAGRMHCDEDGKVWYTLGD